MNGLRFLCVFTLIFSLTIAHVGVVNASDDTSEGETTTYADAKNGVVQVNTVFTDDSNVKHVLCGGTGFLVGDEERTEYVITCNSLINPDEETKEAAYTYLEIDNIDNAWENIDLSFEVVIEGDIVLSATILNSSSDLDMAILQLEQPIYTRTPLTILTSENYDADDLPYKIADVVYALGYPDVISYDSEVQYYSTEQVAMTAGKIVNLISLNGVQVIESDAAVAENNCGGPLINENGYVIGMSLLTKDGMYSCALDSTKITKVLDGLGVEYDKINEVPAEEEDTKLIEQQDEQTVDTTENESNNFPTVLLIAICAIAVVIVVTLVTVIIIFVIKKDNNENQKKANYKDKPSTYSIDDSSELIKLKGTENTITTSAGGSRFMSSVSDETTILSSNLFNNDGETILLSGELNSQRNIGTLIRRRTLDNIPLNKSEFVLGKDAMHADYCIDNNNSISRKHALISYEGNRVYIQDCNSTNGTYVNGVKLEGQSEVVLNSGDVIKLANEEFEYRA